MTLKQQKAINNVVGNGGNVTKAMIEAGYSPNTANTPQKLTESKAWMELMDQHLPDGDLLAKHKEALEATKPIGAQILIGKDGKTILKENEGMIEVPDHVVRLKAVELGYRVKGKLRPEEGATNETKILVIPSELITKYDQPIASDTGDSSAR